MHFLHLNMYLPLQFFRLSCRHLLSLSAPYIECNYANCHPPKSECAMHNMIYLRFLFTPSKVLSKEKSCLGLLFLFIFYLFFIYFLIFSIVQSTVSDLLKDSNPLGLEWKSPGSSSSLKYCRAVSGLEPLSPGMGTWKAASRPACKRNLIIPR